MQIRQLTGDDGEAYLAHRQMALRSEPFAFLSSPDDDVATTVEDMRRHLERVPESVVFGAFDPDLIGSVGIYREPKLKAAHRAHIWGMYVRSDRRCRGVARALIAAAIDHARSLPGIDQVQLGVTEASIAAQQLYESLGFRQWGIEPRYIFHEGRYIDTHHMVLVLGGR